MEIDKCRSESKKGVKAVNKELIGQRCVIMAHRGACIYAPQNTIPAFVKAFDMGFTSFETDVHCTGDGELVICHDYKINNVSDGFGKITDYTLDKLKTYDFGAYFSEQFKGVRIPTLDDLLKVAAKAGSGIMNIEIKPPRNGEKGIAEKVISTVKNHGLYDRLLISSFDPRLLLSAKKYASDCRTAYLYPNVHSVVPHFFVPPYVTAKEIGVYSLHPHMKYISPLKVEWAHRLGFKVCPWTVNRRLDMEACLAMGVDGLITDRPELAREVVEAFERGKNTDSKKENQNLKSKHLIF